LAHPFGAAEQVGNFFGQDHFLYGANRFLMLQSSHLVFEFLLDALLDPFVRLLQGISQTFGMLTDSLPATVNMGRHVLGHTLVTQIAGRLFGLRGSG
jgi:hypothetical protein